MTTVTKPAKDARFFSSMSNARRALKKVFACDTDVANALIHLEAIEDGGRYWFSEAAVNKAANPSIEADKLTTVTLPTAVAVAPAAPAKVGKSRSEVRNGVRRPIKGKCADVWAELDTELELGNVPTIELVRTIAAAKNWNVNNATIEFYGWRKFHGHNAK